MKRAEHLWLSLWGLVILSASFSAVAWADDWPTYMHDNARSGVTRESLSPPLHEQWVYQASQPPSPAWPAPAEQDYWHGVRKLSPPVVYDRAFHVVCSGGSLFFGSSSDDKVYSLNVSTGKVQWTFCTDGPVRLAPALQEERLYVGSDDGSVRCLEAKDGSLVWQARIVTPVRELPGNGRVISLWPIRTGILVDKTVAYCAAGIFPTEGVTLCALSTEDGRFLWRQAPEISAQGYLSASPLRLFVPTGRTSPVAFDRLDGKTLSGFDTAGGTCVLLTEEWVMNAPGRQAGQIDVARQDGKELLAVFDGLRAIVDKDLAYLQSEASLKAILRTRMVSLTQERDAAKKKRSELAKSVDKITDPAEREKAVQEIKRLDAELPSYGPKIEDCTLWQISMQNPYAMIKAGKCLFLGGDNRVSAIDARNGKEIWTAPVKGAAYGLAVSEGSLFVSTDQGSIHCFSPRRNERPSAPLPQAPPEIEDIAVAPPIQKILDEFPDTPGYALVIGSGEGQMVERIARETRWSVVGVEPDADKVASSRQDLDRAGLYGTRATVQGGPIDSLPFVDGVFNLVLWEKTPAQQDGPKIEEILRVTKPFGGLACFSAGLSLPHDFPAQEWEVQNSGGFHLLKRGKPPGAGEWTHLYANPANTACSQDTRIGTKFGVQWFGLPGPRKQVDRHHRSMSPLVKDGILFVCGNEWYTGVDAYNGAILWERGVPGSRRLGMMNDTGNACLGQDRLYVAAQGECVILDTRNGETRSTFKVPHAPGSEQRHWGYIACSGRHLIGSTQKPTASFKSFDYGNMTVGQIEGDFRLKATSDGLFVVDPVTGQTQWTWSGGVLLNSAVVTGEGWVGVVVSEDPDVLGDEDGRMSALDFCKKGTRLVSLDLETGTPRWNQPFVFPFEHILFLSASQDILLATGSKNVEDKVQYEFFAFDTATGLLRWHSQFQTGQGIGGSHGEQWQHPVLTRDRVYLMPFALDLATGQQIPDYRFGRGGGGCGTITASAGQIFMRGGNPMMFDMATSQLIPVNRVSRPGCWVHIIPAGGLILAPETSSGCTCGYPVQASFAYAPR